MDKDRKYNIDFDVQDGLEISDFKLDFYNLMASEGQYNDPFIFLHSTPTKSADHKNKKEAFVSVRGDLRELSRLFYQLLSNREEHRAIAIDAVLIYFKKNPDDRITKKFMDILMEYCKREIYDNETIGEAKILNKRHRILIGCDAKDGNLTDCHFEIKGDLRKIEQLLTIASDENEDVKKMILRVAASMI